MASSAVSSVLQLCDAAGNHADTRTGAYIYYGDAACFHEWEIRIPLRIAGKSGDAFVAAQEIGFDNLCEIVDARPRGIDTLIQHIQKIILPLIEHESKELFRPYRRPGSHLTKWRKYEKSTSRDDDVAGHSWFRWTQYFFSVRDTDQICDWI